MNKNIAILTVHKSINIGSFLQAYALKTTLESMEYNVKFIDNKSRQPIRTMLTTIKNHLVRGRVKKALFSYRLFTAFIKSHKIFDNVPMSEADSFDTVILGSDEIWNVKRKVISDWPSFFGIGINSRKIAYAPSLNNAVADDLSDKHINALNDIAKISVRDSHTKDIIEAITQREAPIVCDPTWLLKPEEYPLKQYKTTKKYILVYMYNSSITDEEIAAMTSFAKKHGLALLSVNNHLDWCDSVITAQPFEYLAILKNADFVLTNTFHGTILSILFNKPFASYEKNNLKISEALSELELSERKLTNPSVQLEQLYESNIEWQKINEMLEQLRSRSKEFLKTSLNEG